MTKKRKPDISRRDVLRGASALSAAAVTGCGDGSEEDGSGSGAATKADELDSGGEDSSGGDMSIECMGGGDLSDSELLAPIENIVVLMMENRSFDHYFGGGLAIAYALPQADRTLRPFARRRFRTLRPFLVAIRERKPTLGRRRWIGI